MNYTTIGKHVTVDLWGVSFVLLNDEEWLTRQLRRALTQQHVQVLSIQCQSFTPQGITVLAMLAESHASIHTYPEKGFAALDCYTCGDQIDPVAIMEEMIVQLQPKKIYGQTLHRGDGPMQTEGFE